MARHKYSFKVAENMAKVVGRNLSISTKHAIEISGTLRGMNLDKSKQLLAAVIKKKRPILMRKFTEGAGHRAGVGAGKYPVNASKEILLLLESVTSNAQAKGLATGKLEIVHINAHRGTNIPHRGRQKRRLMKQTHVEVVVAEESSKETKAKTTAKSEKVNVKRDAQK